MVAANDALINPRVLEWARESAGFFIEEAAKKIPIASDKLRNCEAGHDHLTISQLRKLSNAYRRPIAFFYLPTPPERELFPNDFRRLPEDEDKIFSPKLRIEIRRATYRREIAVELFKELEVNIPKLKAKLTIADSVYDSGKLIRQLLNVSFEEQRRIHKGSLLNFWREKVEGLGILVFSASMIELMHMRGFSIDKNPLPIIVLNSKDHHKARVFTLFHELTHLLLHAGGICDLGEQNKVEVFCNAVAGEALVPKDWLETFEIVQHPSGSEWYDADIVELAQNFGVGRETLLRRLLTIGKTTEEFYKRKRNEYQLEYRQRIEREKVEKKSSPIPQHYKILNETGRRFARLVFEGYNQQKIGLLDVSEYLGTKLKHLPKIEQTLNPSFSVGDNV